jgi:integrase
MEACRRPSTLKLYARHWEAFTAFCGKHGKERLPAVVTTVLAYMQLNLEKSGSVQNNVAISAAISAFHEKSGFVSPCGNKLVRNFVTGVKKTMSKPITRKEPLTKEILMKILRHCASTDLYNVRPSQTLPLWREAIFEYFAFLGMARLDDLLHVEMADISFNGTHMTIFCKKRKNDSLNRGHSLLFKITGELFCPKRMLELYLLRLQAENGDRPYRGFLLPFLKKGKLEQRAATYAQMRNTQYAVLAALKLDPKIFGCHSGRRGSCKASKRAGGTDEQVRIAGGWSENSTTPQIYDDDHEHSAKFVICETLAL